MYKDFTEMAVWQLADTLIKDIYELSSILPRSEDYALTSQIRRAALSVGGNIAEAFGRGHLKDKINFYLYARGSSYEVKAYLISGTNLNYFDTNKVDMLMDLIAKIAEALNKMIKTLKSQSQSQP